MHEGEGAQMSETAPTEQPDGHVRSRTHRERVRTTAQKHWLGAGANPEQLTTIEEIRRQYLGTAREYYKSACHLYDNLHVQKKNVVAHKAPFPLENRNVQLFLAYSILWEAFNHIYTAASYTHFALHGAERDELEDERAKIDRVLRPPILTDADLATIKVLKNGETVNSAINRMINRSSRELKELYGVAYDQTLTDMNAFLQGVVEVEETRSPEGNWLPQSQAQSWVVKALDSSGRPIDPESEWSAEKYRSVIKWHCYQIRNNLNFVGKTEGSIDDAILIIRAFCLVEPVVALLLQESRRAIIFAL
jgi:hypothetical protein